MSLLPACHHLDGKTVLHLPVNWCTVPAAMWQLTSFARRVLDGHKSGTIKEHDCSHVMASLGVVHSMWLNPDDLDQVIDSHCQASVAEREHFILTTTLLFYARLFSIDHYFSIFPASSNCSAGPSETDWQNKQTPKKCCHCIVCERDWFIFFLFLLTCFWRCSFSETILDIFLGICQ